MTTTQTRLEALTNAALPLEHRVQIAAALIASEPAACPATVEIGCDLADGQTSAQVVRDALALGWRPLPQSPPAADSPSRAARRWLAVLAGRPEIPATLRKLARDSAGTVADGESIEVVVAVDGGAQPGLAPLRRIVTQARREDPALAAELDRLATEVAHV